MRITNIIALSLSALSGLSLLAARPAQAFTFSYAASMSPNLTTITGVPDANGCHFNVQLGSAASLNAVPFTTITPLNLVPVAGDGATAHIDPFSFTLAVALTDGADTGKFNITGVFGDGDLNMTQDTATFKDVDFFGPTSLLLNGHTYIAFHLKSSDPEQPGGNNGAISFRVKEVPEPGTYAMLVAGATTGMGMLVRRRLK